MGRDGEDLRWHLRRSALVGSLPHKKGAETGPLFDVDNMLRVFEYNPNLWQTTVEKDMPNLRDFIKGAWDNRASEKSYMKILRGAKTKAV